MTTITTTDLPQLYSVSSAGKIKTWGVGVVEIEGNFYVKSYHGYIGSKIVEELSSAKVGKNIGKKNETTPLEQAWLEASSKWQSKRDKNYTENIEVTRADFENLLPMLAHSWKDRKHNAEYPGYQQPKLNGVRALFRQELPDDQAFTSRSGKAFDQLDGLAVSIREKLKDFPYILDGEIFNPIMSFQEIVAAVKRKRLSTNQLEYWVYDIADTNLTFKERAEKLKELEELVGEDCRIVVVDTFVVNSEEEFLDNHAAICDDVEGSIFRNAGGMYRFDYRSPDLLKHKDFIDAEFEIIGAKSGSGSDEGTAVFRCLNENDQEFDVKPEGPREYRKELLTKIDRIIGKKLTVRFQNYSDTGIPIFPVGISIRDYE